MADVPPVRQLVRVGSIELEAWVSSDRDGSIRTIHADNFGQEPDGSENWPRITDLGQVFPADLPTGFTLTIYQPALCFSAVESLTVDATTNHKRFTLCVGLYFDQWHLDCNLIHFASKFVVELQAMHFELDLAGTEVSKNEYVGMFVEAQFELPASASIETAVQLGAKAMQAAYKQTVRAQMLQPPISASGPDPQPLTATRWWAERFIVPVIGSGAVSGIIGWLLGKAS